MNQLIKINFVHSNHAFHTINWLKSAALTLYCIDPLGFSKSTITYCSRFCSFPLSHSIWFIQLNQERGEK